MAISYVWGVLRKFLTQDITESIRGMRMFKDQQGAVFDVPEDHIQRFDDVFNHLKEQGRIHFEIGRAKTLPELREDDSFNRGPGGSGPSYGGGYSAGGYSGGYGASRGGYGQGGYGQSRGGYGGNGGGNSYGGNGGNSGGYSQARQGGAGGNSDERTVFVGNLGFSAKEQEVSEVFRRERLNPIRIRMLQD